MIDKMLKKLPQNAQKYGKIQNTMYSYMWCCQCEAIQPAYMDGGFLLCGKCGLAMAALHRKGKLLENAA